MADYGTQNDALILALARGLSIRAEAAEAEIGERTAHRRLADPDFQRRVSTARAKLLDAATGRLADSAGKAADTLRELLDAEADGTRLAAARAILQQSVALREAAELEQRVTQLEESNHGDASKTHRIA